MWRGRDSYLRYRLPSTSVGRLIRLAFLAPDLVESIVEGRQPTILTDEALTPTHRASALLVNRETP